MNRTTRYLAIAAFATILHTAGSIAPTVAEELTVSTAGGVVSETESKIFAKPFTDATGWSIKHVSAEGNRMAQIEGMVKAGKTSWDVSEISASDYPIGVDKGLLEPIDYALLDPDNKLPAAAKAEFGVVAASYSTVLVQRLDKNPDGKKMTSWTDFWDLKAFPGRGLSVTARSTISSSRFSPTGSPRRMSTRSSRPRKASTGPSPSSTRSRTASRYGGTPARSRCSCSPTARCSIRPPTTGASKL